MRQASDFIKKRRGEMRWNFFYADFAYPLVRIRGGTDLNFLAQNYCAQAREDWYEVFYTLRLRKIERMYKSM